MAWWLIVLIVVGVALIGLFIHDVTQTRHTILRNFPIIGHLRYALESLGPELRQYIVADNDEERPFSRDQRRWVYASAKQENVYFGFGTDNDIDRDGYLIIKHSVFPNTDPIPENAPIPCAKVLGEWRNRPKKFRPKSIVATSAMSYGSLSAQATEAINRGCGLSDSMQNTGEGGISDFHRKGGDLNFQFGTGYFGCRNSDGTFSMDELIKSVNSASVKMIEIKLSQGAKPGLGGVLPAKKVTPLIAEARGVPIGQSVFSPNAHSAFTDVESLIDFVEAIADATGLPVGIKSAIGQIQFWEDLTDAMVARQEGPDFVVIDGGEGGTGAAPLVFSDHVALPFRMAFARVYSIFQAKDLHHDVVFGGSGKLGFPGEALVAMTLGADFIGVAREVMLAVGCIQAQECHSGHCPTGVATHSKWLTRGLDPTDKSVRVMNYMVSLREEILKLSHACGVSHPALVPLNALEMIDAPHDSGSLLDRFGYDVDEVVDHRLSAEQRETIDNIMTANADRASSAPR